MKLICILEAAQSETARGKKEKVEIFTKKIVEFLLDHGFDTIHTQTRAKIYPCKNHNSLNNCSECRFRDICGKMCPRYAESKKVVVIHGG